MRSTVTHSTRGTVKYGSHSFKLRNGMCSKSVLTRAYFLQLFDNAAFLLFSHPFDVEDEIVLEGTPYIVDYIALPYINLLRKSDDAFIRVTTQQLRHHRIHNVSR